MENTHNIELYKTVSVLSKDMKGMKEKSHGIGMAQENASP